MSRMDEFREFVGRFPKIRDDVRTGKRTWQNIYEEWVLYGEQDGQWAQYQAEPNPNQNQAKQQSTSQRSNSSINMDSFKNIVNYIRGINPDSINRTLNTVQKVIQIAQSFGSKSSVPTNMMPNSTYNDWWD